MTVPINYNTFERNILLSHKFYKQGYILNDRGLTQGYCFANLLRRVWRWIKNDDHELQHFIGSQFHDYWNRLGEETFRTAFQRRRYTAEDLREMDWFIARFDGFHDVERIDAIIHPLPPERDHSFVPDVVVSPSVPVAERATDTIRSITNLATIGEQPPLVDLERYSQAHNFDLDADDRICAHILGEYFAKGTGLEGINPLQMLNYTISFIEGKPSLRHLNPMLRRSAELYNTIFIIKDAEAVSAFLTDLPVNETVMIPGGWASKDTGHAIYYTVTKQRDNSFTFKTYNSGDGLRYHTTLIADDTKKYHPFMTLTDIPLEDLTHPFFLRSLNELSRPPSDGSAPLSAQDIYQGLLRCLRGNVLYTPDTPLEKYTLSQQSAICGWAGLALALGEHMTHNQHCQFIHDIQLQTLVSFYSKGTYQVSERDCLLLQRSCADFMRYAIQHQSNDEQLKHDYATVYEILQDVTPALRNLRYKQYEAAPSTSLTPLPPTQFGTITASPPFEAQPEEPIAPPPVISWDHFAKREITPHTITPILHEFCAICTQQTQKSLRTNPGSLKIIQYAVSQMFKTIPCDFTTDGFWSQIPPQGLKTCMDSLFRLSKIKSTLANTLPMNKYDGMDYELSSWKTMIIQQRLATATGQLPGVELWRLPTTDFMAAWGMYTDKDTFVYGDNTIIDDIWRQQLLPMADYCLRQRDLGKEAFDYRQYQGEPRSTHNPESIPSICPDMAYISRLIERTDQRKIVNHLAEKHIGIDRHYISDRAFMRAALAGGCGDWETIFPGEYAFDTLRKQTFLSLTPPREYQLDSSNEISLHFQRDHEFTFITRYGITCYFNRQGHDKTSYNRRVAEERSRTTRDVTRKIVNITHCYGDLQDIPLKQALGRAQEQQTTQEKELDKLTNHLRRWHFSEEEIRELSFLFVVHDPSVHREPDRILKILSYFKTDPTKLAEKRYQDFLKIILFENLLLEEYLAANPAFANIIVNFVNENFDFQKDQYNISGCCFFALLASRLQDKIKPETIQQPFKNFIVELKALYETLPEDDTISRTIINKQILGCYQHLPHITEDQLTDILWRSFYTHANPIPKNQQQPSLEHEIKQLFLRITTELESKTILADLTRIIPSAVELFTKTHIPHTWHITIPQCSSTNGIYSVDLSDGCLRVEGRAFAPMPRDVTQTPLYQKLFGEQVYIANKEKSQGALHAYTFTDATRTTYRVSFVQYADYYGDSEIQHIKIQRRIDGQWHTFIDPEPWAKESPFGSKELVSQYRHWLSQSAPPQMVLLKIDNPEDRLNTTLSAELKIMSITRANDSLHLLDIYHADTYLSFLKDFEPLSHIHLFGTDETHPQSLEIDRLGLKFHFAEGKIISDEFDGFFIAKEQRLRSLEGFRGFILLENDFGQRRLILPRKPIDTTKNKSALSTTVLFNHNPENKLGYYIYEVGDSGNIDSPFPENILFLAYFLLARKQYALAQQLIRNYSSQVEEYSPQAREILDWFLELHRTNLDGAPEAQAVYLCSAIQLLNNIAIYGGETISDIYQENLSEEYNQYLSIAERSEKTKLTHEEELTLLRSLPTRLKFRNRALFLEGHPPATPRLAPPSYTPFTLASSFSMPEALPIAETLRSIRDSRVSPLASGPILRMGKEAFEAGFYSLYEQAKRKETFFLNALDLMRCDSSIPSLLINFLELVWKKPEYFLSRKKLIEEIGKYHRSYDEWSKEDIINHALGEPIRKALEPPHPRYDRTYTHPRYGMAWDHRPPSPAPELPPERPRTTVRATRFPKRDLPALPPAVHVERTLPKATLTVTTHRLTLTPPPPPPPIGAQLARIPKPPRSALSQELLDHDEFIAPRTPTIDTLLPPTETITPPRELLEGLSSALTIDDPLIGPTASTLRDGISYHFAHSTKTHHRITNHELLKRQLLIQKTEEKKIILQMEAQILSLANKPPADTLHHATDMLASRRHKITIDQLIIIFLRQDKDEFQQTFSTLSTAEIDELNHRIMHYLTMTTRQQQICRCLNLLTEVTSTPETNPSKQNKIDKLHAELTRQRTYHPDKRPEFLVFEHYSEMMLYPQQSANLEKMLLADKNMVLQMIMGDGKTAVLLPILAEMNANGDDLSIVVVPEPLKDTVAHNMLYSSGRTFQQHANVIEFDRSTEFSIEYLTNLRDQLERIRKKREFVLITSKSLHCLSLKLQEALLMEDSDGIDAKTQLLLEIQHLIKTKGHAIVDEADTILNTRHEVNFAYGEKTTIADAHLDVVEELYTMLFSQDTTVNLLKPIPRHVYETTLKPQLIDDFIRALPEHTGPLGIFWHSLSPEQQTSARAYFNDTNEEFILLTDDPTIRNILSLVKEQINELLPLTLSKQCNTHYGFSHQPNRWLAIPYLGNNEPNESSVFGNHYETLNYTLRAFCNEILRYQEGNRDIVPTRIHEMFAEHIKHLQDNAKREIKNKRLSSIKHTNAYREFMEVFGHTLPFTLKPCSNSDIDLIFDAMARNNILAIRYVRRYLFPRLQIHTKKLNSGPHDFVAMFSKMLGFTGTPWNRDTYHPTIETVLDGTLPDGTPVSATDGKTVTLLWQNSFDKVTITHHESSLEAIDEFVAANPTPHFQAFIDSGAFFNGITNIAVARRFLARLPDHIHGVVFYHNDQEVVLERGKATPVLLKTTSYPKKALFTYYDHRHTTGADIAQEPLAEGLLSTGMHLTLRDLLQAVWRLRQLDKQQKIKFIIPRSVEQTMCAILKIPAGTTINFSHILKFVIYNEASQKRDHCIMDANLRISHIPRQTMFDMITSSDSPVAALRHQFKTMQPFFVFNTEDHPFLCYGQVHHPTPREEVIDDSITRKLETYSLIQVTIPPLPPTPAIADTIHSVIKPELLPPFLPKSVERSYGTSVEIEEEAERDIKREVEREIHQQVEARGEVYQVPSWTLPPCRTWDRADLVSEHFWQEFFETHKGLPYTHTFPETFDRGIVDPAISATNNFLPIGHAVPWDIKQKPHKQILVLQNKRTGETQTLLLGWYDVVKISELLRNNHHSGDVCVALYDLSLGVVQHGHDPLTTEELCANPHFIMQTSQIKFFNAELFAYTPQEEKALTDWISHHHEHTHFPSIFDLVVAHQPDKKAALPGTLLGRVFRESYPE